MEIIVSIFAAVVIGICIALFIDHVRSEIRRNYQGSLSEYLLSKFFSFLFICFLIFFALVLISFFGGNIETAFPKVYNFDWKEFFIKILGIMSIIFFSYVFFVESDQREQKKLLALRILIPLFLGLYLILFY